MRTDFSKKFYGYHVVTAIVLGAVVAVIAW